MNRSLHIVGLLLFLSPFFNFLMNIAMLPPTANKWTWAFISMSFMAATPMQWALRISKLAIGYLMMKAKSSAWLPVMVILAVTIAYNVITFSKDFQTNKFQAISSITINLALFGLILNAEIQSQKELNAKLAAARKAKNSQTPKPQNPLAPEVPAEPLHQAPESNVIPFVTSTEPSPTAAAPQEIEVQFEIAKGSHIDFHGFGDFAEVVQLQDDEIWIRGLSDEAPLGITSRPVILESSENGASVRLHYLRHNGPDIMIFKVA